MPESMLRRSLLEPARNGLGNASVHNQGSGIRCAELKFVGQLNLRGDIQNAAFERAVQDATGVRIPKEPNSSASNGETRALWLGPDEWLLITSAGTEHELQSKLRGATSDMFCAITDVTDNQVIFRISGPHVFELLAKGCSLNLSSRAFKPGDCAQSAFARVGVTLHYVEAGPVVDLIVRRSFSDYLLSWLEDAALEYGLSFVQQ